MAEILQVLEASGAILKGHFRLSSGRHSDTYFEKFRALEQPDVISRAAESIANHFVGAGAQAVAGPTTGGILIAFEVARQMKLSALYIERESGERVLRRGAVVAPGTKVLVVDDVLTTGGSIFEVISLLKKSGAEIVGVGALVDRSEHPLDFGAEFFAAAKVAATSYPADAVPDWLDAIPLSEPGTRNAK